MERKVFSGEEWDGIWTFFVLDFDGTYDNEWWDYNGVEPSVYLIPLYKVKEVEQIAINASEMFNNCEDGCDWCIGDYFEDLLKNNKIDYQEIGHIDLTFGERQEGYLADYLPRVIV